MEKLFLAVAIAGILAVLALFFLSQPAPVSQLPSNSGISGDVAMKNANGNDVVLLKTNMGDIKIKLFEDKAPITTANFKKLVKQGFYDGTIFHRVISDFMIQGGDPTGTGTGGPGYTIKDEFVPELKHGKAGILSMANTGMPNTGGSQFFITLVPTPWLDGKHSVFGEVIEGTDVVEAIGKVQTRAGDRPVNEVKIIKASVLQ